MPSLTSGREISETPNLTANLTTVIHTLPSNWRFTPLGRTDGRGMIPAALMQLPSCRPLRRGTGAGEPVTDSLDTSPTVRVSSMSNNQATDHMTSEMSSTTRLPPE